MNSKSTAEAVLRQSVDGFIVAVFIFEFQVYCGSGIETQSDLYGLFRFMTNSKSTAEAVLRHRPHSYFLLLVLEFQVYCGSGIETHFRVSQIASDKSSEFQVYCGSGIETYYAHYFMFSY